MLTFCSFSIFLRFHWMKYVVRLVIICIFLFPLFYSNISNANNLVIAPLDDPALKNLLIRTMFVDKKKRIYIGTDSGIYRYANNNLVKLDDNFAISANAFNGAISSIAELDDRYLAIIGFLSHVVYFDRVKDGYVAAPYGINKKAQFLTSEQVTDTSWIWNTQFELLNYSSASKQYKTLLFTSKDERIYNFKYNKSDNSLYVMTQKGLYFTEHIDSPLQVIFTIGDEYFSGASLINDSFHYLSNKRHLRFKAGELVSQVDVNFCPKVQSDKLDLKSYEYLFSRPYFYDISANQVMAISECGVYQYDVSNYQLKALILPKRTASTQWLKGTGFSKNLPIILETTTGLFFIDKDADVSMLRNKTSASLGGSTFSIVTVNQDQYLIADGTPGLKIASRRLNQFSNLTQADLERLTGGHSLRDIIKIDDNTLWLSSQTKGLFKITKQGGLWQQEKQYLANTHVRSLYKDNNILWVATEGRGLHQINLVDNSIRRIASPKDHRGLLSFLPLNNGQLLIGTTNGALLYNKAASYMIKQIEGIGGAIWAMAQDSKDNIWLGTHAGTEGLFKLDNNFTIVESYTYADDLFNSAIMDMALDENEQPVLATWGGGLLYRKHNENTFSQINTKDGLLNGTVQSVIKLDNNQYWLSTEKGLAKVNLCHVNNCTHQVKTYTTYDGLSTNLFDINSAHLNEDGSLIYGGFFGLTWFDPKTDIIENNVLPSEHYVNNLTVDGENVTHKTVMNHNQSQLRLSHDTQHINISFNSDDYINQNNKKYRYKINDSGWTVNHQPEINLSALAYGHYLIEAGSSNSDGLWAKNNLKLLVIIDPPIWLSFYAKISYLIIFILSIFVLFKVRNATLLKQNQLLENKVKEKTILLSEAITAKEHMFESSSHELQTPLTLILNYLDLLPLNQFSEKHADYISIVKNQSKRLRYLVKYMLLNADTSLRVGQPIITNIVPAITTLIGYHKAQADKANISLIVRCDINSDVFVNLRTDADQIIFGNLIDNAIKYSPNNTKVTIELSTKKNDLFFCISDQGSGFKNLNKVGEKYYRESSQIEGTGLGLWNVINCVNKSEGNCLISNNDEGGGRISITLPLCEGSTLSTNLTTVSPTQENSQPDFSTATPSSSYKILLVEDDINLTSLFKETLALQFNIQFCNNGQQAIQYLHEVKDELPEVIISDVMMPLMSGFELCKEVKSTDEFKHIPFLLLTAKSDNSSQQKGLFLGADDYINKPFEMTSLQLKINNIINTNNARKKLQLDYITTEKNIEKSADIEESIQHDFITQVRASLKANLCNSSYNINDLASTQHMSVSTLRRKLKQFFDQTFTEILKKSRINKAKELLSTDKQIQLIVENCGYTSHSYFNKHFKAELGLSPKEFRANLIKNHEKINS